MDVKKPQRKWLPGRQTLIRTEPPTPAGARERPVSEATEAEPGTCDPVYDWFDLRRTAERTDAPSPRGG